MVRAVGSQIPQDVMSSSVPSYPRSCTSAGEGQRDNFALSHGSPSALLQALLFVFSILRKVAWDYGRLALVTDADR